MTKNSALQWFMFGTLGLLAWVIPTNYTNGDNAGLRFLMLPVFSLDVFLALACFSWLLALTLDEQFRADFWETCTRIFWRYGGIYWLGFVLWMLLSSFWATSIHTALIATLRLLVMLSLSFLLADLVRRGWGSRLLWAFGSSAVFQSVIALGQAIYQRPLDLKWLGEPQYAHVIAGEAFRSYGLTRHPNVLGGFLLIGLFIWLSLLRSPDRARSFWVQMAYIMLTLITGLGMVASLSRAVILAGGIGLLLILTFLPHPKAVKRTKIALLLGAGVIGTVIFSTYADNLWVRMQPYLQNPAALPNRLSYGFSSATDVINTYPLLGIGANNLVGQVHGEPIAHNVYLIMWANLGAVGLTLFLMGCVAVFQQIHPPSDNRAFMLGCGFVSVCIAMLFDYYFGQDANMLFAVFWLLGVWWGYTALQQESVPAVVTSKNRAARRLPFPAFRAKSSGSLLQKK